MKTTIKLVSLLALVAVLVLSITSVAQAWDGYSKKCPGDYGRDCTGCIPNPAYPNLYHCLPDGRVANWNNTCTWYSSYTLNCDYPRVCHCVDADHADHCESSCAYQ